MVEKFNSSAIYKSIILIILVNLPSYLSTFLYKKVQIQQPEEPREQHLGEIRQGMLKVKFNVDPIALFINQSKPNVLTTDA